MTPEEYERLKNAEKEHLKKLRELKKAVRVLERQKKTQSALNAINTSSSDVLDAQKDAVERLAMETARHEARLEVAMDSAADEPTSASAEQLEETLQRERARTLVEQLKASMGRTDSDEHPASMPPEGNKKPSSRQEASMNPTKDRADRPEKTIGRM